MNNSETTMTYDDLPSFIKQRLWNNKSLTIQIDRVNVIGSKIEVKIINNETNNTKSAK